MDLKHKKILVTGAGGFIGSHLTEKLVRLGANVKAFVKYNSKNDWGWIESLPKEIKEEIEMFSGDVRDPYGVKASMKNIDTVFHLASLIGIPYSYHSPDVYVDTNIKGTLNILQAARELGAERVVHTSTSEIYGTAQFVPITEEHPVNPQSPYAATKSAADFLALSFYRSFDLPVSIVRPFNTYGPRQSARAIIPTVITQIANGNKQIKVGSVTPTRDMNFVSDTVNGFVKSAFSNESIGEIINIGSNFEISIKQLINTIASLMESDVEIITDQNRIRPKKSEVERLYSSNEKAKRLLDWSPQYSLEQGLKETIDWFNKPENIIAYKHEIYNI
ncbi:MAG: SDR family NAD(P)-dependent oxidoreductase [Bacteroidetes bacterium]|nr:SDR family NAD(P)-dependent oxidoreductase [Bacteroidota bacterium]